MPSLNTQSYRDKLLDMQHRLRKDYSRMIDAAAEDIHKTGDDTHLPTHNADQDIEGLDSEIILIQNEREISEAVHEALQRIEQGTYGQCQQCDRRIAKTRLDAIPYTPYCLRCAEEIDRAERELEPGESA